MKKDEPDPAAELAAEAVVLTQTRAWIGCRFHTPWK